MKGRLERAARDPVLDRYREAFEAARRGGRVFIDPATGKPASDSGRGRMSPLVYPKVSIYAGEGASHSWIWFADLLERCRVFDVDFIQAGDLSDASLLAGADILLVGGGDTYEIARSIGPAGARAIESRVSDGALYYGSCAGAYLVLSGVDREPFAPFSLIEADMLNVMGDPPPPRCLAHKYLAEYGEELVFHPVYGEVLVAPGAAGTGLPCFAGPREARAPLLGGPVMEARAPEVAAVFSGLTDRAAYLWPREDVESLLIGKPAVCASSVGRGSVVVSGPHLEHPMFPRANALVAELLLRHCGRIDRRSDAIPDARERRPGVGRELPPGAGGAPGERSPTLLEIKRQLSNSRIVAFGLEKMPVTWKIGLKVWEPEKVRMFLEVAWSRLPYVEAAAERAPLAGLERLAEGYAGVTEMVKSLKISVESGEDSQAEATSLLITLKELTASFLWLYFRLRMEEKAGQV
jgi:hypothetical protein